MSSAGTCVLMILTRRGGTFDDAEGITIRMSTTFGVAGSERYCMHCPTPYPTYNFWHDTVEMAVRSQGSVNCKRAAFNMRRHVLLI